MLLDLGRKVEMKVEIARAARHEFDGHAPRPSTIPGENPPTRDGGDGVGEARLEATKHDTTRVAREDVEGKLATDSPPWGGGFIVNGGGVDGVWRVGALARWRSGPVARWPGGAVAR